MAKISKFKGKMKGARSVAFEGGGERLTPLI